jgi:hypothetical protein
MNFTPGSSCQSCAMPMRKNDDHGSEKDASRSEDYCCYCYQNGDFVNPDMSLEEMIGLCASEMDEIGMMPYEEARKLNERLMPPLKRWRV